VKPFLFDPFNSRLARDIRNSLSKSFIQALAEKDISLYQRCGAGYMQQKLEPGYAEYIETRLAKYENAYAIIEQKNLREVLQQALIFWDNGLYFEMHELLEPAWKEAEGDRRKALQGLIRAAGMKIHAQSNNMKAALSMGAKAMADLITYSSELRDCVGVESILAEIKHTLSTAQNSFRADEA
jgi:hypothetical protein